jgi:hypothetical protein
MYKLKVAVKRGSALLGAVSLLVGVGASAIPAFVSADALNPLTDRSLTLSSSSPGWDSTDGSGNGTYAPPNSGANGAETGNTFQFNVSTDNHTGTPPVMALSFQYCTAAAGGCTSPGNDGHTGSTRNADDPAAQTTDLNVVTSSPSEISSTTYGDITSTDPDSRGNTCFEADGTTVVANCSYTGSPTTSGTDEYPGLPKSDGTEGDFVVLTQHDGGGWTYSPDWDMSTGNEETGSISAGTATGKHNLITLTNTGSGLSLYSGDTVKVVFYATATNYITNPGAGAFFVLINDYQNAGYQNTADNTPVAPSDVTGTSAPYTWNCGADTGITGSNPAGDCPANAVDGGVTVANVMNQSIEIQTKVLETMDFSVGTVDPDTLNDTQLQAALGSGSPVTHGECDDILTAMTPTDPANTLTLGDTDAQNSLATNATYATDSYWRLSSNSSAGATVYYSGTTLSNTEGDQIAAIGPTMAAPHKATPQFGLALDNGSSGNYDVNYSYGGDQISDVPSETPISTPSGVDASFGTDTSGDTDVHDPQLAPLVPTTNYGSGTGGINTVDGISTEFAFDPNSISTPVPIATESSTVVDCVTGKMRYVANIAATTPAGIYTTKVNYIAAPQY